MAATIVTNARLKKLRPVTTLGEGKYDNPYKLYRINNRFYIIAKCERYNGGCGLFVAFEETDLIPATCGGYGGFDYSGRKFICPRCKTGNWIDTEVFPAIMQMAKVKCLRRSGF